jgi:malonyl-CoA/methylmalonyl-CoA synthetase
MPPIEPLFPGLVQPDSRPALRFGEQIVDYSALAAASSMFRRSLAQAGLTPGDRVAIWAHPTLDTVVALIGSVVSGMVLVPLNPGVGERELRHVLDDAQPDAIFSSWVERDQARTPEQTVHGLTIEADSLITPRMFNEENNDRPALIVYTSGTTGAPKGAVLTPRNIATSLDGLAEAWALGPDDTIVHALPLFHVHGLVVGLFGALRAGACLHFVPKFDAEVIAAALKVSRGVLYAVPTMVHRLADAAERSESVREGLAAARLLISGSAGLSAREHARVEALTGQRPCERYGLTETLINTAVRHDDARVAGSVGRALTGIEVRIVDDQRVPLTNPEIMGEVAVRGTNVFSGYLNNPQATAQMRDDEGWFYTGDLGTLSPDGQLRIVGRKASDLIKTGGFKVGAGEVEGSLLEHPAVAECAVLGVPDPDLGERIVAFVILRAAMQAPTQSELCEHVALSLAQHKRPREVRFVDELPRNALGKVLKAKLREAL